MIATIVGIGLIRGVKMYQINMINAKTGGGYGFGYHGLGSDDDWAFG